MAAGRPKLDNKMTKVVSTRLTNEQTAYVDHFAKEHGISFGTAIRTIIDINKQQSRR